MVSNMHWLKEDVYICTSNVTSALLNSAVDVVIYLKRYSYCSIKTESESLTNLLDYSYRTRSFIQRTNFYESLDVQENKIL